MQVDDLSRIFGIIFSITAFVAGIYAYHMKDLGQQVNALLYTGSALGVTFAGGLLTLIIYWEIMAVISNLLIWARGIRESDGAGIRYLIYYIACSRPLLGGLL